MSALGLLELVLAEDTFDEEVLSLRAISRSGVPCSVTVQRDGAEALDYLLDETRPIPNLVILDFRMPKLDGLEVLTALRLHRRTQAVPVLVFSGATSDADIGRCYAAGANRCLAKPDDPREYVARLADAVRDAWSFEGPS